MDSRDPNSPQWGYLEVSDTSDLEYDAKDINWNDIVLFVHDQKKNPIEKTKFAKVSNSKGAIKAGTTVNFEMIKAELHVNGVTIPSSNATNRTKLWVARITDVIP